MAPNGATGCKDGAEQPKRGTNRPTGNVYLNWTVQLLVRALIAPTPAEEEMAVPSSRAAAPVQPLSAESGGACVKTPYRNDKEHCRFAEG
jgi:hypothetical protein